MPSACSNVGASGGQTSPLRMASRFSCRACCFSARLSATARSRLRLLIVCCRFLLPIKVLSSVVAARAVADGAHPRSLADGRDVLRLGALGTLGRLVLDLRALGQRLVAVAGDGRVVHEEILAAVLGAD